ncbi:unnamed protein product [Moneuplotes crassus]|uniref:B box-type domain-containing protein n=1 Tax=Euplotes crassus TaxID=5936 RepID=A0AAD1YAY0_EUPCR|nr:unnamed protein product [Moneuplotes crassus]
MFRDRTPGVQKLCNHNDTDQLVLYNHPEKESLVVCKSCFRTVAKEQKKRICSTSIGRRRPKRMSRQGIRLQAKQQIPQNRLINTARNKLRSRNRLNKPYQTTCCPDRKERIKFNTGILNTLKSSSNLFKKEETHKIDFALERVFEHLKNDPEGRDTNFCINHPHKEIEYICCDDKIGICSDCLYDNYHKNSKVIHISSVMSKLHKMLIDVERNSIKIIHQKGEYLREIEGQSDFIEQEKRVFLQEEREKIDKLHEYIDNRYSEIITKYNQRIEQRLLDVYNSKEKLSKDIDESLVYLKRLQSLNESISEHKPTKIIEDFAQAIAFIKKYKKFKEFSKSDAESFKNTFSNHLNEGCIVPAIDIQKEIQTLKEKFDQLNYGIDKREDVEDRLIKPMKQFPEDNINRVAQTRRLYLPRWMSKTLVEYDVDSKDPVWETSECQSKYDFLPFSKFVYLPNYHIISIGGLNEQVPGRSIFVSRVLKVLVDNYNMEKLNNQVSYKCEIMQPLKIARGMMGAIYHDGFVYVAGGVTNKVKDAPNPSIDGDIVSNSDSHGRKSITPPIVSGIFKCERYCVDKNTWEVIAPMNERRKNPTLCAIKSGIIYVFGGCQRECTDINSIERYIKVEEEPGTGKGEYEHCWEELRVFQPDFISLQIAHLVNNNTILLFGGSIDESNGQQVPSKGVFKFVVENETIFPEKELEAPIISIYPSFQVENQILMIDEKQSQDCPRILRYDI